MNIQGFTDNFSHKDVCFYSLTTHSDRLINHTTQKDYLCHLDSFTIWQLLHSLTGNMVSRV